MEAVISERFDEAGAKGYTYGEEVKRVWNGVREGAVGDS